MVRALPVLMFVLFYLGFELIHFLVQHHGPLLFLVYLGDGFGIDRQVELLGLIVPVQTAQTGGRFILSLFCIGRRMLWLDPDARGWWGIRRLWRVLQGDWRAGEVRGRMCQLLVGFVWVVGSEARRDCHCRWP